MVKLIPREILEANWPDARPLSKEEAGQYATAVAKSSSKKAKETLGVSSNLFKILRLNQEGIRTGTLPELDNLYEIDLSQIEGHYVDSREVILRGEEASWKPNAQIVKDLVKMLGTKKISTPLVLKGLELEETGDEAYAEYGLRLTQGDGFEVIEAPDFSHENNERKFKAINPDYTLCWAEGRGEGRMLYTKPKGVSRLYLCDSLLNSYWSDLAYSNSNGRVVVVDAGGVASLDSNKYLVELKAQRDLQREDLESRYKKACEIMQGKE